VSKAKALLTTRTSACQHGGLQAPSQHFSTP
jgi:hypothetical protein